MLPRAFFSTATFKLQTSNPCAQALGAAPSDPIVQHCMCQASTVPKHQMLSGCLQLCMCCSDVFCPNLETTRESERQRERERENTRCTQCGFVPQMPIHAQVCCVYARNIYVHPSIHPSTYLPTHLFVYLLSPSLFAYTYMH